MYFLIDIPIFEKITLLVMKRILKSFLFLMLLCWGFPINEQLRAQSTFKFYDDISLPQTDAWNFVRQGEVS